jgi:hypothetical protein
MWQSLWATAQPVLASAQKPLVRNSGECVTIVLTIVWQ